MIIFIKLITCYYKKLMKKSKEINIDVQSK